MKTILIGCKLPCGIELDIGNRAVMINGMNTSLIAGGFGLTNVDADDWVYLSAAYSDHAAFKNKSIFTAGTASVADAASVADELRDEKTGLEGIDPKKPGAKLVPENESKLDEQLGENAEKTGKPRRKASAADRAAALELAQG